MYHNNQTEYYGEECFKNSLNMNLNVSGFKKGEMSISNDIKIVFSTVVHFEARWANWTWRTMKDIKNLKNLFKSYDLKGNVSNDIKSQSKSSKRIPLNS